MWRAVVLALAVIIGGCDRAPVRGRVVAKRYVPPASNMLPMGDGVMINTNEPQRFVLVVLVDGNRTRDVLVDFDRWEKAKEGETLVGEKSTEIKR